MAQDPRQRPRERYFPTGLTICREAWQRYRLDETLDEAAANESVPPLRVFRELADRMNRDPAVERKPVYAGHLLVATLVQEVLRHFYTTYTRTYGESLDKGLDWTANRLGHEPQRRCETAFVALFPPEEVRTGQATPVEFLGDTTRTVPNRHLAAREMALLELTHENPAYGPFRVLNDDADLAREAPYRDMTSLLEMYFEDQPVFPALNEKLYALLRAPMKASPDSLDGQADYIIRHWGAHLPEDLLARLGVARDIMKEETAMRGLGPGAPQVLRFGAGYGGGNLGYPEPARFSIDKDWMSNVVLIAKSVYVWLDQLSRRHGRHIGRLDEIPDSELDQLARWGFSGLWLIGLWERSPASQKIKQIMGNPEAVSSAYSLYDYVIADDLGGEGAYNNLRERAALRGIRLASDMVPNHVGIYSRWVVEHPDWFIQASEPPFPSYQFTGENLSWDDRVVIEIEDGYWAHRDAAVVFRRTDRYTGDTRYIYHGNDGTNMPWNDTAQLNFLLPAVREAVVQTIIHVARMFPIIRFDAAMTLAKKHYQRLWFPLPGEGGAIPSRAEHSMTRAEFDRVFPEEFWREVVDRVAAEVPDTLLLAEAFWLMEGYFVRTLGMHRVYNSAFMNMLKLEDNQDYRTTVKNVLEFSPEILKRFVNFMNNPDEDTAVAQFGKGDKYFGVAVMMVTMPGLPMFGHGQIEGFAEKYGMEYRRAYWHEEIDDDMVRRHEREIFPLMRRRHLFSGAHNFALFDFIRADGHVDESVFAYSNAAGPERALVLYNNAYPTTSGHIHTSSAINVGGAEDKHLVRLSLTKALNLSTGPDMFVVFRDHATGLEYVRQTAELASHGFYAHLRGYQYSVYLDFREVRDTDGSWRRINELLEGAGVDSVEEERQVRVVLAPLLERFRRVMCGSVLQMLSTDKPALVFESVRTVLGELLELATVLMPETPDAERFIADMERRVRGLARFEDYMAKARLAKGLAAYLAQGRPKPGKDLPFTRVPAAWCIMAPLGIGAIPADTGPKTPLPPGHERASDYIREWRLGRAVTEAFRQLGAGETAALEETRLVELVTRYLSLVEGPPGPATAERLEALFYDARAAEFLGCNWHDGIEWHSREHFERLLYWCFVVSVVDVLSDDRLNRTAVNKAVRQRFSMVNHLLGLAKSAGYRVRTTIACAEGQTATRT